MRKFMLAFAVVCLLAAPAAAAERWESLPPPLPLPPPAASGFVKVNGATLWYGAYGAGPPVVLLHGGLASSETWGAQVQALSKAHRVILIDTRGHGRSTRDGQPFSYDLMASDVIGVMDRLKVERADLVGWSDGAIVGLTLAMKAPGRVGRLFAFAANSDPSGLRPDAATNPTLARFGQIAAGDYRRLSPTPDGFAGLAGGVMGMWATQPRYTTGDLVAISAPVTIAHADHDEGIKREHAEYLARTIPHAKLIILSNASHFAHLQDPMAFNAAMLRFLDHP
ncbi:MAG: alpha/beta hydrolase [Phenylobacterium sp.]|uniref:alpha/beta fold hydrolase n=1 Tax=Phenylobacterium sp. TaxID=1871053 RepID=UPI002734DA62|nr:alpha/beta hydrolase [Phenylobacterium sp.]MDP3749608.1 alpha/beta hydrolase [Phenylobacterium sp.]